LQDDISKRDVSNQPFTNIAINNSAQLGGKALLRKFLKGIFPLEVFDLNAYSAARKKRFINT